MISTETGIYQLINTCLCKKKVALPCLFWSLCSLENLTHQQTVWYACQVYLEGNPSEVFVHLSPTRCWEMVRDRVNQEISKQHKAGKSDLPPLQPSGSPDGFEMFGYSSPAIVQVNLYKFEFGLDLYARCNCIGTYISSFLIKYIQKKILKQANIKI